MYLWFQRSGSFHNCQTVINHVNTFNFTSDNLLWKSTYFKIQKHPIYWEFSVGIKIDQNDPCGYRNVLSKIYKKYIEFTQNITNIRLKKIQSYTNVNGLIQYLGQEQVLNMKVNLTANRRIKLIFIGKKIQMIITNIIR